MGGRVVPQSKICLDGFQLLRNTLHAYVDLPKIERLVTYRDAISQELMLVDGTKTLTPNRILNKWIY